MKQLVGRNFLMISFLFLALIISGCSSSSSNQSTNSNQGNQQGQPPQQQQQEQQPVSDFPKKDIEFVVGYNAGGGYSDYAQGLAPFIQKHLPKDVNVLVRHMPGAGSVTATNYLYSAKPDGYIIKIFNVSGLAPTQVSQDVAYDLSEITWLGRVSADNNVGLVRGDSPYKTIEDLDKNKQYIMSTKGLQSQDTVAGAVTLAELGIDWVPLNHQGTGEAALAVMRGDADLIFSSYESVQQYIESGDLRPIIYYSDEKHPDFPNVPIPSELGLSVEINEGFNAQRLIGAPPGLPDDVRDILIEAIEKAIEDPEFLAQMEQMKRSVLYLDPAGSADLVNQALSGFTKFSSVVDELYSME